MSHNNITSHYRETTLGQTLQESLDDLKHELAGPRSISNEDFANLRERVLQEFDKEMTEKLSNVKLSKNRLTMQAELCTYRHCDNVWQMVLENVEIGSMSDKMEVDRLKIVACEAKSSSSSKK